MTFKSSHRIRRWHLSSFRCLRDDQHHVNLLSYLNRSSCKTKTIKTTPKSQPERLKQKQDVLSTVEIKLSAEFAELPKISSTTTHDRLDHDFQSFFKSSDWVINNANWFLFSIKLFAIKVFVGTRSETQTLRTANLACAFSCCICRTCYLSIECNFRSLSWNALVWDEMAWLWNAVDDDGGFQVTSLSVGCSVNWHKFSIPLPPINHLICILIPLNSSRTLSKRFRYTLRMKESLLFLLLSSREESK